jgi:hypothetical protein
MTVAELITELAKVPQDFEVRIGMRDQEDWPSNRIVPMECLDIGHMDKVVILFD